MTLQTILSAAQLDAQRFAAALRVNPRVFNDWIAGRSQVPDSIAPVLSAVLGISPALLTERQRGMRHRSEDDITPQIWFKFRGPEFSAADRDFVLVARQLGHYLNEIEEVTGRRSVAWKSVFQTIRAEIDPQAPPREQGKAAARLFRQSTSLGHGATGIGDVLRGLLRSLGILMLETPVVVSKIEGCSFLVGATAAARPCILVNSHRTAWFRRNAILLHEVGHAIFEAFIGASLDFVDAADAQSDIEMRAQGFAQEVLIPREVLIHAAQSCGIKWQTLGPEELAQLVASTHAEQKVVIDASVEAGFIGADSAQHLRRMDIAAHLRRLTTHALTTEEYLKKTGGSSAEWIGKRKTTQSPRPVRLPVGYVKLIVDAYKDKSISPGKAAEYLMIGEHEFLERFGDIYDEDDL